MILYVVLLCVRLLYVLVHLVCPYMCCCALHAFDITLCLLLCCCICYVVLYMMHRMMHVCTLYCMCCVAVYARDMATRTLLLCSYAGIDEYVVVYLCCVF